MSIFQFSDLGSRVPGPRSKVSGFRLQVSGFGFQASGFGFRANQSEAVEFGEHPDLDRELPEVILVEPQHLPFRVSGFGFRVSNFGFRVSGFGFRVSDFGFRTQGSGIGVEDGAKFMVWC